MKRLNLKLKKYLEAIKQFMGEQLSPARKYVRMVFNLDVLGWAIALFLIVGASIALYKEARNTNWSALWHELLLGLERAIPDLVAWLTSPYGVLSTALLGLILFGYLVFLAFRLIRSARIEDRAPKESSTPTSAKKQKKGKWGKLAVVLSNKIRRKISDILVGETRDIVVKSPGGEVKNIARCATVSFFRGGKLEGKVRSSHLNLKVGWRRFVRFRVSQIVSVSKSTFGLSRTKVSVKLVDGSVIKGKLPWSDQLVFAIAQNSDEALSRKAWFAIRS